MGGIGVSIFLVAVGAILAFAVDVNTRGVNVNTVGVILMIGGGIGLLLSMLFWSTWSPYSTRREETIVRDDVGHRHDHVV
ncbi:MAG: DUF6458 family protein [Actinomycetota bacterium]